MDLVLPGPRRHPGAGGAPVQVGVGDAGHHPPVRAGWAQVVVADPGRGCLAVAGGPLVLWEAPQVVGGAGGGGAEVVAQAEVGALALEAPVAVVGEAPMGPRLLAVHLHGDGGRDHLVGRGGGRGRGLCSVWGLGGSSGGGWFQEDVEGAGPLPAVCLQQGGRRGPGDGQLEQVALRVAQLVGLLLQQHGSGGAGGGRGAADRQAEVRVVVGLQVHGRDVTHFAIVSTNTNENMQNMKTWNIEPDAEARVHIQRNSIQSFFYP